MKTIIAMLAAVAIVALTGCETNTDKAGANAVGVPNTGNGNPGVNGGSLPNTASPAAGVPR